MKSCHFYRIAQCSGKNSMTLSSFSMTFAIFHDFPGLENGLPKFHDFPWPGGITAGNASLQKRRAYKRRSHANAIPPTLTSGPANKQKNDVCRIRHFCCTTIRRVWKQLFCNLCCATSNIACSDCNTYQPGGRLLLPPYILTHRQKDSLVIRRYGRSLLITTSNRYHSASTDDVGRHFQSISTPWRQQPVRVAMATPHTRLPAGLCPRAVPTELFGTERSIYRFIEYSNTLNWKWITSSSVSAGVWGLDSLKLCRLCFDPLAVKRVWLGGRVVSTLDLRSIGREFESRPLCYRVQPWANC